MLPQMIAFRAAMTREGEMSKDASRNSSRVERATADSGFGLAALREAFAARKPQKRPLAMEL